MFIETIFPPLPSEIVMPFAGYLANYWNFSFIEIITLILYGNFGTTLGAVLIYYISLKHGRKYLLKYGKYFSIDEEEIKSSEKWFKKYGSFAVFICRIIPGIRSLISIPAGITKMDFKKFLTLTFIGSLIWTSFLFFLGFILEEIFQISKMINFVGLLVLLAITFYFIFKFFKKSFGFLHTLKKYHCSNKTII
jgi:membrane protein DedA with SNARE-associated domain